MSATKEKANSGSDQSTLLPRGRKELLV